MNIFFIVLSKLTIISTIIFILNNLRDINEILPNEYNLNIKNNTFPIKQNNKKLIKKLAIVVTFDSEKDNKRLIYKTLNSILSLNYKYYFIYLIYNNDYFDFHNQNIINIISIKEEFNNVFSAYNKILKLINDFEYICFLSQGDILNPAAYDFLEYVENYDIYQIGEYTKHFKIFNKKIENKINFTIYNFIDKIPNNSDVIYDKIYKIELLKNYSINFILHEKSLYYFNLLAFTYAKNLLFINQLSIRHIHNIKPPLFYNNLLQESIMFRKILAGNKNLTKNIIEEKTKIDYVFPYVTTNDSNWQKLYKEYLSGEESSFVSGMQRFRDNGLLKYLFRSLEKYLPWLNKVHMIVMSESQIPNWIDRKNVHIIYHSEFIPKKYLPAFSSNLIETFLPFLPEVEEKFIYGNDDLIPCRLLSKNKFFRGNIPCYSINIRDFSFSAPGDNLRRNAFNLITGKKQNKRVINTQHSTISYRLSLIKNCFQKYKNSILKSVSRFREEQNFNQYIYSFYQMMEDTILNIPQKIYSFSVRPALIEKLLINNFNNYDYICLNDEIEMENKDWSKIISKFEILLPNKSKYEK